MGAIAPGRRRPTPARPTRLEAGSAAYPHVQDDEGQASVKPESAGLAHDVTSGLLQVVASQVALPDASKGHAQGSAPSVHAAGSATQVEQASFNRQTSSAILHVPP